MGIFVLCLILMSAILTYSAKNISTCINNRQPCEWYDWAAWGPCSAPCGGGGRYRARGLCCFDAYKHDPYGCLNACHFSPSDPYSALDHCNEFCYNGGTYDGHRCNCKSGYTGTCCEKIPTTTEITTVTTKPTTTTVPASSSSASTTTKTIIKITSKPTTKTVPLSSSTQATTKSTSNPTTTNVLSSTSKAAATTNATQKTTQTTTPKPTTTNFPSSTSNKAAIVTSESISLSSKTTTMNVHMMSSTKHTNKGTSEPPSTNAPILASKLVCSRQEYNDCQCVISNIKKKIRSVSRDVEFGGFGLILGILFSIGTYIFWNRCNRRVCTKRNVTPTSGKLPAISQPLTNVAEKFF